MKKTLLAAAVFVTLSFPLFSQAALDTNLKYGSSGSTVTELQEFLTAQGVYSGPITGNFYSLTLAGVKAFQTRETINPISGFWGPLSRARAQAMLDISDSNTDEQTQTGAVVAPVVAPAPVVDTQTQAQLNALTNQVSNLTTQIQNQTVIQQQIAANTTPVVVQTPVDAPVVPTQVNFDAPFAWAIIGSDSTNASVGIHQAQAGDVLTVTFNGQTIDTTITSNKIRQNDRTFIYTLSNDLASFPVGTSFPYTIKLTRSDQYAIKTGTIVTVAQ